MAIFGWFILLVISVCLTLAPVPYIALSALGGGVKRIEVLFLSAAFILGLWLIYHTIKMAPFTVVAN